MIDLSMYNNELKHWRERWKVDHMWIFGSAVRNELRPDSDLDVMVSISPVAPWGLFEMIEMQMELETIFGRKVDLVEREFVQEHHNWIFRDEVLSTAEPLVAIS